MIVERDCAGDQYILVVDSLYNIILWHESGISESLDSTKRNGSFSIAGWLVEAAYSGRKQSLVLTPPSEDSGYIKMVFQYDMPARTIQIQSDADDGCSALFETVSSVCLKEGRAVVDCRSRAEKEFELTPDSSASEAGSGPGHQAGEVSEEAPSTTADYSSGVDAMQELKRQLEYEKMHSQRMMKRVKELLRFHARANDAMCVDPALLNADTEDLYIRLGIDEVTVQLMQSDDYISGNAILESLSRIRADLEKAERGLSVLVAYRDAYLNAVRDAVLSDGDGTVPLDSDLITGFDGNVS